MAKSIRRNLTIGLSTVIVLVGLMAGSIFYFITANNADKDLDKYMNRETNEFSNELSIHLWNFDHDTVNLVCSVLLSSREVVGVRVLGEKNSVIFEEGQFAGANSVTSAKYVYFEDNIVGKLYLVFTKDLLWETKRGIIISSCLVVLCIVITFIPVMIILLKRSLAKPLQQLKDKISYLSMRRYEEASSSSSSSSDQKIEFQGIEDSFSKLSQDLEAREKELEGHRLHLESLVDERTKELRDSQTKLVITERLAVVGKLSSGIAHEIRNPLAAISASAYYLKEKLQDADEKIISHIERINNQVDFSNDIIQNMQNLTEMKELKKTQIDIAVEIEHGINVSKVPQTVNIINEVLEGEFIVSIDAKQVSIVFKNILTNAIQAMDNKGTIRITAHKSGDKWLDVSFQDSGPGITQEGLKKIFQPFFGTKTSGFGFGLALCKTIMEKHGGDITAQSEAGKEATFTVRFPC